MKTKIIFFFVFGLFAWLIATNYQVVYSKMANWISPESENTEVVAQENESTTLDTSLNNEAEENIDGINNELDINNELTVAASDVKNSNEELEDSSSESLSESLDESTNSENTEPNKDGNEEKNTTNSTGETEIATVNSSSMPNNWMHSMQPNVYFPTMNPNMMNPASYMNPYAAMMPMMMNMMGPMMNPAMWMNPMAFINHPVNVMTQSQNMDAMMRTMDPKLMFGMFGQPSQAYLDGETPDQLPVVTIPGFPTQSYENWPKNTVSPNITREAKLHAFQTAMAMSPLSMRNMVSMMAEKIPVDEGVSWDDAVESMKLRANEVNFKFVGSSPLWKQIEAETEEPSAKVEMFRFCDARMARKILDEVPEFIVFLPCKIALLEDAEGKLWVMTLDWDVSWLDYAQNPNSHLSKDIREHAKLIRENIQYIMEGAATGDF